MDNKTFYCAYSPTKQCEFVDSSGMTKVVECTECPYLLNRIRPTGDTPILDWFLNLFKRK